MSSGDDYPFNIIPKQNLDLKSNRQMTFLLLQRILIIFYNKLHKLS